MQGIYKITNKINNKSYIGQSIHCGKRLDEHFTGDQYIDQEIQKEGINNFSFEILKVVSTQSQLSYWEDFFIKKFDTLYPNGYNRRLNTQNDYSQEQLASNDIISNTEQKSDKNNTGQNIYQKILKLNKEPIFYEQVLILLIYKNEPMSIQKINFLFGEKKDKKRIENTIRLLYENKLIEINNENICSLTFSTDLFNFNLFFKDERRIVEMKQWEAKIFLFTFINNIMQYKVNTRKCYKFFPPKYKNYKKDYRFFDNILIEVKCKYPFLEIEY